MATFRLEAKIIGRTGNRTAVGAAAYRSGENLADRTTGETFDFRRRHGVFHSEILYPEGVTPFASREDLWNSAQEAEIRCDAQLAREFTLSLPHELDDDQRVELVRTFVREQLLVHGVVADVNIHRPDSAGDMRNHHAHVMMTLRPLGPDGLGKKLRMLNARTQLVAWRASWAQLVNDALERAHVQERVDHRSLRDQGIPREPEPKQGPFATEMERRGRRSHAADERRSVRSRNEQRETRRQRERDRGRTRRADRMAQILSDAIEAISPLIASFRDSLMAEKRRIDGAVSHPGRDRDKEWQQQLLSRHYGERVLGSELATKWSVTKTRSGFMFTQGKSKLEDAGKRISVSGDSAKDVAGILDLAQQKGWRAVKLEHGTAAFKVAVVTEAFRRGLDVVATGEDKRIVVEIRKLHERSRERTESTSRDRDATATVERDPDRAGGAGEGELDASAARTIVVTEAFEVLTAQQSTFTADELKKTLSRFSTGPEHLAELLIAAHEDPELKELEPDERGNVRYTTHKLFAIEERALAQKLEMAARPGFAIPKELVEKTIHKYGYTEQQAEAFRKLCESGSLDAIVGLAGTGKSYVMKGYVECLIACGYEPVCGALAGVPTDSLARDAGIEHARTLAGWAAWLEAGNSFHDRTVFIGDEWGMVGSEMDAIITRALYDAHAKGVFIGDPLQLQPIAAGAPFRALVEHLRENDVARLEDVRRQKDEWMKEATRLFGTGRPYEALKLYEEHGRLVEHQKRDDAKHDIVERWLRVHRTDLLTKELRDAYDRRDVAGAAKLRAQLREVAGINAPDVLYATAAGTRAFAAGDAVRFLEKNKVLELDKGESAIVVATDPMANEITLRLVHRDNRIVTLTRAEIAALDYERERSQLILTYTRADTLDINKQLRALRREQNELAGPDVVFRTDDGDRAFAVNDNVFFTSPNKDLEVRNGTRCVVTEVDEKAKWLKVRIPEQNDREVTVDFTVYNSVDYSDCCTTHKAQGQTVDVAQFFATSSRGLAMYLTYVAMSRHRDDVHLHWSRDQFSTIGQVHRILCRLQPKDFSLDYSMQGVSRSYGLGVPLQAATAVAVRATYQIRAELRNVLDTATHLRDAAAAELKTQAQRAYGTVTSWFARIDEKLRELESRGVRGVTIRGSAEGLHARLALLERSVADALDRTLAQSRNPEMSLTKEEVAKRLEVLRITLEARASEIRASLANAIDPMPKPSVAIAAELQRLEERVRAGGVDVESNKADLEEARARFGRADVLTAMEAAYTERAESVAHQREEHGELRAELRDVVDMRKRVVELETRLASFTLEGMRDAASDRDLVAMLERHAGVQREERTAARGVERS